ncbi:MAG: VOC family protein [Cyclobacteriaceae bacterium]
MSNQRKFHLALHVSDAKVSSLFYEKLFGEEPVKNEKGYTKFELENPGLVISIIESKEKVHKNFGHLGFRVESEAELTDAKNRLSNQLSISLEEENVACCFARQNKFWVNDPDGYEWEVYQFLEDVKKNDPQYSSVSCC